MKALSIFVLFFSGLFFSLAASGQQPSGNNGRVEIPGVKGVLQIDTGSPWYLEFVPEDKWTMLHARQRPDHVTVTAQLRQVTFAATPESCKADQWPKLKQSLGDRAENLQESSYGGAARVEYNFTSSPDSKAHHLVSYWGANDLCAEVHLIKTGFTPQDQTSFEQILSSVRLFPDQSGLQAAGQVTDSSSSLMAQGNELYVQGHYDGALKFYQRAFELEKSSRTFDKDLFLELIGRLEFCYRLNGNLAKARETLDYGFSQDAEYPLFHYDMACVYAQQGKVDESLGQLRQAYKYKANASPGDMPPDPTEDSCFQKIANDPRFTDAVQKMIQP